MTKKLQTLLDINKIAKQRVEQRFAELVKQREAIKSEMKAIRQSVKIKKEVLRGSRNDDPFKTQLFLDWAAAQNRKIRSLEAADEMLIEQQEPIRAELASIFVRDKVLTLRVNRQEDEVRLKTQKKQADITQSLWLQKYI